MVFRAVRKNILALFEVKTLMLVKFVCLFLVVCSAESIQLESQVQSSTKKPRVTKYSKTTVAPGFSTDGGIKGAIPTWIMRNISSKSAQYDVLIAGPGSQGKSYSICWESEKSVYQLKEPITERSLNTATYRLQGGGGGETCILLIVDALVDISYVTKLNERADANTFVPNNANVAGTCKDGDAETLLLSFKEFSLEWSFAKTPGGERWYADSLRLTYNSSARLLEHAANQGRRVTLVTDPKQLLFPTPVGKSYFCPDETIVDLIEVDANPANAHRAKLYLRQMQLQAFMYKRGGEFGTPWRCALGGSTRSEATPVAVGAALALATAMTLLGYAIWRYLKVKKVQYDTME